MKIRIDDNIYIMIVPEDNFKYKLREISESGNRLVSAFRNVNEAIYAGIDLIITQKVKGEITISQYQEMRKAIANDLVEGVIEIGDSDA